MYHWFLQIYDWTSIPNGHEEINADATDGSPERNEAICVEGEIAATIGGRLNHEQRVFLEENYSQSVPRWRFHGWRNRRKSKGKTWCTRGGIHEHKRREALMELCWWLKQKTPETETGGRHGVCLKKRENRYKRGRRVALCWWCRREMVKKEGAYRKREHC